MRIKEDRSYLNAKEQLLESLGYAVIEPGIIRLDFAYSEEEKAANCAAAETLSAGEWSKRCREASYRKDSELQVVIEYIESLGFKMYQYHEELRFDSDEWDFFYYDNSNVIDEHKTIITLSVNQYRSNERNQENVQKLLKALEDYSPEDATHIVAYAQYRCDKKVSLIEQEGYETIAKIAECGKTVQWRDMNGHIRDVGQTKSGHTVYRFFKQRCKKTCYDIDFVDAVCGNYKLVS